MEKTILTKHQATILDHLSWEKDVHENFYLSGGTALAEFYLHHRLSEDLDFFSEKEFDSTDIFTILKKIQKKVKFKKIKKPRSRDFIDLYCILQKKEWTFDDLIKKAKIKFDWHIDPVQMGSQLLKVTELKDLPRMKIKIDQKIWQNFFLDIAKRLSPKIFKP